LDCLPFYHNFWSATQKYNKIHAICIHQEMGNENENENKVTKESKKKESKNQGSKYQGTKETKNQRTKETHSNHRIKEFKTEEKNKNNTALAKGRWQTTYYYCCVEGCCTYNN